MHVILNILIGINMSLFFGYSRVTTPPDILCIALYWNKNKFMVSFSISMETDVLNTFKINIFYILQTLNPSALKYTVNVHIFY